MSICLHESQDDGINIMTAEHKVCRTSEWTLLRVIIAANGLLVRPSERRWQTDGRDSIPASKFAGVSHELGTNKEHAFYQTDEEKEAFG